MLDSEGTTHYAQENPIVFQQVIITTNRPVALRPLVESAIRSELRLLNLGLERTQHRLDKFEQQYGLASDEFERRFSAGDMAENLDFIEWEGEIKTYKLLRAQQQALQEAQLN